jgi:hypothetical protein
MQVAGACVESTLCPVNTSVHRLVPPIAVTSGSEAGQPTCVVDNVPPPWPTGCLVDPVLPASPELARNVMPCLVPETKA